jgi:hypothetical protein
LEAKDVELMLSFHSKVRRNSIAALLLPIFGLVRSAIHLSFAVDTVLEDIYCFRDFVGGELVPYQLIQLIHSYHLAP